MESLLAILMHVQNIFDHRPYVVQHVKIHLLHDGKEYHCEKCPSHFQNENSLLRHYDDHKNGEKDRAKKD